MEPKLRALLVELEERLYRGGLSPTQATHWARRLHAFTRRVPRSKRLIWSPDGSGYSGIVLPAHIRALPTDQLIYSRNVKNFFLQGSTYFATIGEVCDAHVSRVAHRNVGPIILRELVEALKTLERGDLSPLKDLPIKP